MFYTTPVLVFPSNTVIAQYKTYYEQKGYVTNIFINLPLGHISNSLPLAPRVQITLVYIRHVSNTYSLSVFFKLALWKRFSHWVCCVQICMYLVNPNMTIPDVVLRHTELSENVLGCRVSSWFPHVSNGARVVAEDSHRVSVDWATSPHLTLCQRQYTTIPL